MSEDRGIKETKEALDALCRVGAFGIVRLHDGVQVGDALALGKKMLNSDFRNAVIDGGKGIDKVPAEVADLSTEELEEITAHFRDVCLPKILEAWAEAKKG